MNKNPLLLSILFLILLLFGCVPAVETTNIVNVVVEYDGQRVELEVPEKTTVQQVINQENITLGLLDKVDPPTYTLVQNDMLVSITRVREEFETVDEAIPFERQIVQNESMSEGQALLIQAGKNGVQQVTYRNLFENESQVSRTVFQITTISAPTSEITMVGIRSPYSSLSIPGILAYLVAGNAWKMEDSTANRQPIITTGDLDGYVFRISPNKKWLLITRANVKNDPDTINTLWVVNLVNPDLTLIDLGVKNIVHFADWIPNQDMSITYSTVEKRASAPGWQANNDLWQVSFNTDGTLIKKKKIIDTNSGGLYGWWGITYSWSPDGTRLAYARPDEIGLVDFQKQVFVPLLEVTAFNTHSDWAWVPQLAWSPDNRTLFFTSHDFLATSSEPETDPTFGISAYVINNPIPIKIIANVGMFTKPSAQPNLLENRYRIAFYSALFPNQSDTSHYRLSISGQDGSNLRTLFPPEGLGGMEPKYFSWAPPSSEGESSTIGILFKGNLWFVDIISGASVQVTGDGLMSSLDWR
jgi:hypothetical protein